MDDSPYVRCVAAEALGRYGSDEDAAAAVKVLLKLSSLNDNNVYVCMLALNALDKLDNRAAGALDQIKALPSKGPTPPRTGGYVSRLLEKTISDLK